MKKSAMLCGAALVLGLTACSDATTTVSNENEVLMEVAGTEVTKGDIYVGLKANGAVTELISDVTGYIVEQEVPVTDEIRQEAEDSLNMLKNMIDDEEQWNQFIESTGFESEEEYFNQRVLLAARADALTDVYLDANLEDVKNRYETRVVEIFQTDTEETANQVLEAVKGGMSMTDAVEQYKGDTSTYTGEPQVVTNESGLPSNVWTNILSITEDNTLLNTVQFKTDLTEYYVIRVVNVNAPDDMAKEALSSISAISDEAFVYYLNKYDFTVYDIDVYNGFEAQNPDYLVQEN